MAADTPTGMQPHDDAAALGWHFAHVRQWEQQGLTTQTGYKSPSYDPTGHAAWKVARSTTNKTKPSYPDSATLATPGAPGPEARP